MKQKITFRTFALLPLKLIYSAGKFSWEATKTLTGRAEAPIEQPNIPTSVVLWFVFSQTLTFITKYPPFSYLFTNYLFHYKNRNIEAFRKHVLGQAVLSGVYVRTKYFDEDEYYIQLLIKLSQSKKDREKHEKFLTDLEKKFDKNMLFIEPYENLENYRLLKIRRDYFLDTFLKQA